MHVQNIHAKHVERVVFKSEIPSHTKKNTCGLPAIQITKNNLVCTHTTLDFKIDNARTAGTTSISDSWIAVERIEFNECDVYFISELICQETLSICQFVRASNARATSKYFRLSHSLKLSHGAHRMRRRSFAICHLLHMFIIVHYICGLCQLKLC